jgi:hypothetical protein
MALSSSTANRTPPENGFYRRQLVPDASVVFIQRIEESTFSFPSDFGIEPDFLRIGGRDTEQDTSKMGWVVVYMDQRGVLDATSIELIESNAFFGQNEGVNKKSVLLLDKTLTRRKEMSIRDGDDFTKLKLTERRQRAGPDDP